MAGFLEAAHGEPTIHFLGRKTRPSFEILNVISQRGDSFCDVVKGKRPSKLSYCLPATRLCIGRWAALFIGRWFRVVSFSDDLNLGITEERYRLICNQGHDQAQARIILVGEVAESPVALWGRWNRKGTDECFAYVGRPTYDYRKITPTICVPAPPGMVFVVFVLPDGTIDVWTWRKHADGDISTPLGVEGELIWRLNQN